MWSKLQTQHKAPEGKIKLVVSQVPPPKKNANEGPKNATCCMNIMVHRKILKKKTRRMEKYLKSLQLKSVHSKEVLKEMYATCAFCVYVWLHVVLAHPPLGSTGISTGKIQLAPHHLGVRGVLRTLKQKYVLSTPSFLEPCHQPQQTIIFTGHHWPVLHLRVECATPNAFPALMQQGVEGIMGKGTMGNGTDRPLRG